MRPGLFSTSVAEAATFASVTGTWSANYPVTNLADPVEISKVGRVTPSGGAIAFTSVWASAVTVAGASLVAHTLPAGATVRMRFYSDSLSTLVEDVAATAIPTPLALYPQSYPVLMAGGSASIRSVRVDIASAGASAVDIGALMAGDWWDWPYIAAGMEAGFRLGLGEVALDGGGAVARVGVRKRIRTGQIGWMDFADSTTKGLDFQTRKALAKPFVFCEDYDTPANFPRDCFLAVNSEVPPMVAVMFDRDAFQFRFTEHRR